MTQFRVSSLNIRKDGVDSLIKRGVYVLFYDVVYRELRKGRISDITWESRPDNEFEHFRIFVNCRDGRSDFSPFDFRGLSLPFDRAHAIKMDSVKMKSMTVIGDSVIDI